MLILMHAGVVWYEDKKTCASQTADETLVPFQSTSKDLDFPLRHEVERPDKRT